ncbi:oxidoreductase [Roseovarius sp. EL26]|uniref:oxidoreductase n=1 Tax=Roseovarius sp. EL26 TaxID=2126672 RepID=UPI000EA3E12B|nr:oxidoreductase [Roseovarius sp. EL26]
MINALKAAWVVLVVCLPSHVLSNETVLTVSGDIAASDKGETWAFDIMDLKALSTVRFETSTIWTERSHTFEGVLLITLLNHVGASKGTINAIALNDYAVKIPTADAVKGGPIIAYMRDGVEMSIRDKGPLWIIYPFDDNKSYRSEEYYSRSVWQLNRLEVIAEN